MIVIIIYFIYTLESSVRLFSSVYRVAKRKVYIDIDIYIYIYTHNIYIYILYVYIYTHIKSNSDTFKNSSVQINIMGINLI